MLFVTDNLHAAQHPRKRRMRAAAGADIGVLHRHNAQRACQFAVELAHLILKLDCLRAVHIADVHRTVLPDNLVRI